MSEQERIEFGEDLFLMKRLGETGGINKLGPRDLYSANGRNLVTPERTRESIYANFARLSIDDIDGLSASKLKSKADKLRKEAYADMAVRLESRKDKLKGQIESIDPVIKRLERDLKALEEENKEIEEKAKNTVKNLRYTELKLEYGTLHMIGAVDVTNTFEKDITLARFNVRSFLANQPNVYTEFRTAVKLDPPLESGETRKGLVFKNFLSARSRSSFKTLNGEAEKVSIDNDVSFKNNEIVFKGAKAMNPVTTGYRPKTITLNHTPKADNQKFTARRTGQSLGRGYGMANEIKECERLKVIFEKVYAQYDGVIAEAKALAKDPKPSNFTEPKPPLSASKQCG